MRRKLGGAPQQPVLGDVRGELVVGDLQQDGLRVPARELVGHPQPAAQRRRAIFDADVAADRCRCEGGLGVDRERGRHGGEEIVLRGVAWTDVAPASRVGGVAQEDISCGMASFGVAQSSWPLSRRSTPTRESAASRQTSGGSSNSTARASTTVTAGLRCPS